MPKLKRVRLAEIRLDDRNPDLGRSAAVILSKAR